MLIKDIINENVQINETLSKIVFHYAPLRAALNILKTGNFELSSSLGSVEQQYAPKGYPYFMSTTRTRHGGYHSSRRTIGYPGVLFVLDGDWFNNKYPSKPVDYWLNRNPKSGDRSHEAEDRVFSKEPKIPINGITSVHVYLPPDGAPYDKARARQIILNSKLRGIPVYYYTDNLAWQNLDTRKRQPISSLRGPEPTSGYNPPYKKGYMMPWIELMYQKDKNNLSNSAKKIIYDLRIDYYKKEIIKMLLNDLSNSRKPNSGVGREHAIKIIKYMRDNKLEKVSDFVDHLYDKWKNNFV